MSNKGLQFDSAYLKDLENVLIEPDGVIRACFKNKPVQEFNSFEELREWARRNRAVFDKGSTINGEPVTITPAFRPTNQRQRDWLSAKVGAPVKGEKVQTFGSRFMANAALSETRAIGIKTTKDNWPIVYVKHSPEETAKREKQSEQKEMSF